MYWIKDPVPLEPQEMIGMGVRKPESWSFCREVEVVPVGFSEIVPCSLFYPLFFGFSESIPLLMAGLGAGKRNVFVNSDGSWKVSVIPKALQIYPFGLIREGEDYIVVVEKEYLTREGEPLFGEGGEETPYFKNLKTQIEDFARDLHEASSRAKTILELGLGQPLRIYHRFSFGELNLERAFSTNFKQLSRIQPEKIYRFIVDGTLPVLMAQNLSMRNFALFEVFYNFEGQLAF